MQASHLLLASTLLDVVSSSAVLAQIPAAHPRQIAGNMIGLIEYCHSQGLVDEQAVAEAREAFKLPPNNCPGTDPADVGLSFGREGELAVTDGGPLPLQELARQTNGTVEQVCHHFAEANHKILDILRQVPRPPIPVFGCSR